ncbi:hypothetical protein C1645_832033 [Glomus cerebriforme]|uniref:Uncharacterized protein n=1 Tax=Glomus cerebriforme TaxID=658196 RepID=A0A397SIY6_9GLOM|nr:hypothetical protein C1645_832033 [Glomus cerebriforme]
MSSNLLDEPNKKLKINISKDDENFLKNFSKDFYCKIIETNDFNNFEKFSIEWIKSYLDNSKNPKNILELMKNHEQSKVWFTILIGFFYRLGIGCDIDKEETRELYLLAINNEIDKDKDTFDSLINKKHYYRKIFIIIIILL